MSIGSRPEAARAEIIRQQVAFLCCSLINLVFAQAQVNPTILSEPWQPEPHWAETVDEILYINQAHTKGTGQGTSVFYWDSYGRIKVDRNQPDPKLVIGYRVLAVTFDTDFGPINGDYWDVAIVGAGRVEHIYEDWNLEWLGGAGTANDNHWENSDAVYGVGGLGLGRKLDESTALHGGIYYDGNRSLWPDVPLPYVTWRRQFNEQMTASLGFPVTTARYCPIEPLWFELAYSFPDNFTSRVSFELVKNVILFAQYVRGTDAFSVNDKGDTRLFYELQRVNGGVRWITKLFDLSVGLGYAFDQEFTRGYDIRSPASLVKLSEEPFFAVKLQGTF